jgi:hypothetical protein
VKYSDPAPARIPELSINPIPIQMAALGSGSALSMTPTLEDDQSMDSAPAPALTSVWQLNQYTNPAFTTNPAPAPAPTHPRPKARMKSKAKETGGICEAGNSSPEHNQHQHQHLTLEPAFQWEVPIDLDPLLDPVFPDTAHVNADQLLTPWQINTPMESEYTQTVNAIFPLTSSIMDHNTEPAHFLALPTPSISQMPVPGSSRSPRKKGKNADLLAIEEAKQLKAKTRSRR